MSDSAEIRLCVSFLLFALCIAIEESRQEIEVDVENAVEVKETSHWIEGRRSSE